MKSVKLAVILVMAGLAMNATPAHSQVSFLAGLIIGSAAASGGRAASAAAAEVKPIYTLPDAAKRVKDSLKVRFSSVTHRAYSSSGQGKSLKEIFKNCLPWGYSHAQAENFEILEVVRIWQLDAPVVEVLWFAFTEKENLLPPQPPSQSPPQQK